MADLSDKARRLLVRMLNCARLSTAFGVSEIDLAEATREANEYVAALESIAAAARAVRDEKEKVTVNARRGVVDTTELSAADEALFAAIRRLDGAGEGSE